VTAYLQTFIDFIGLHPNLAIAAAFLVSAGEALPIIGLFSPSTVVLVGIGGLVGLGKASFWPVFLATVLGASVGDAFSYWTGRIYKEHLVEIWPFSRHPGLLTTGQRHFARRGGMSIVIGRFVPGIKPVVSGVAGMMGMGAFRFTILNLLSAIAWAAVHILPGVSAGLALTGLNAISKRLAIVIGLLVIGILLAMWFTKVAIGSGLRLLTRLQMALLGWAQRRGDRIGHAIERLVDPDHADFRLLIVLNIILIGAVICLTVLIEDAVSKDVGGQLAFGFVEFLQSLRTTWADTAMVAVTMLGDWPITASLGLVGCVALLVHRRFRLAIGFILALVGGAIFVEGLRLLVYPQPDVLSIRSGDVAVTATLYGALGWIAVRGAGANFGGMVAGSCVTLIVGVAFSRLYLADPWPADVAAGLLFGAGATAALALVFRGYEVPRRATIALIAACTSALAIVGSWHIEQDLSRALSFYAPQPAAAVALSKPWRDGGWKELPAYRIDIAGEAEEPLLLQWRGTATALQDELKKQGWVVGPAWSLSALNAFTRPDTGPPSMPVIPKLDDGRMPTLAMIQAGELTGEPGRFVLRAWSQDVSEPDGSNAEILVGSIYFERIYHPLSQLSVPIGTEHRTCNGDQLLSGLTNASRVGERLAGPQGSCGGQVVLAW
jgi:membrane protein DedA with SNARE-associated domain/membrane-associated phospholipid phosphatase